jgi:hypothetical protein
MMPRDDDEDELPRKKRRREDDDDDDDEDRPRRKRRRDDDDDEGSSIIPTKNGQALAAYYCGVFSLIPGLGCILGPIAFVLGILGAMHAKKYPKAKGMGHAITGIVLGVFGPFIVGGLLFAVMKFMK